jgi:GNAT superfamily N-acetyltransferase
MSQEEAASGATREPRNGAIARESQVVMPLLRKLFPTEADRLRDHFLRLDPEGRHLRFGTLSDAAVADYVERIDWLRSLQLGWFEDDDLRGLAQLVWRDVLWPQEAELATSVEAPYRDRGIATTLVARALRAARNRGIRRVAMLCLAENAPMLHIARKLEGELAFADGFGVGHVDPGPADPASLVQEWFEDGAALVATLAGIWRPTAGG